MSLKPSWAPSRSSPAERNSIPRKSPDRQPVGSVSPRRSRLTKAVPVAARVLSAAVANDCGPPHWTGISPRPGPVLGDPLRSPARLCPGIRPGNGPLGSSPAATAQTARAPSGASPPMASYRPPCLLGSRTVNNFRPFFLRRASVARPHRVDIRARNPCLLTRFRFRGRYVGCMTIPQAFG